MARQAANTVKANHEAVLKLVREHKRDRPGEREDWNVEGERGLVLRLTGTGAAVWSFRYGKSKRVKIGRLDEVSLADARTKAAELRANVAKGADPAAERDEARQAMSKAPTFGELWEQRQRLDTGTRPSTYAKQGSYLTRLAPELLSAKAHAITRPMLAAVLARIEAGKGERGRGGPAGAHDVKAAVGATFRWANARGYELVNPAADLVAFNVKPVARERRFSADDLRDLWLAFDAGPWLSPAMRAVLKLCLLTGQRVGNIVGAKVAELEGLDGPRPLLRIPGDRMKEGKPHVVPLSQKAAAIFCDAIASRAIASEYVFPASVDRVKIGSTAKTPHVRVDSVGTAMDRLQGRFGSERKAPTLPARMSDVSVHSLRKASVTWMKEQQVAPYEVRRAIQAHAASGIERHYEFADLEAPMRRALEWWAAQIESAAAGADADTAASNVVSFAR